jgi:hypothetical protein
MVPGTGDPVSFEYGGSWGELSRDFITKAHFG